MENKSSTLKFKALLEKKSDLNATFIEIPLEIQKIFNTKARIPVKGTINGFPFRTSLSPYGGIHYMPVNKSLRTGAAVKAGDIVEIILEQDNELRTVKLPPELEKIFKHNEAAFIKWEKLCFTHKKEFVNSIEDAKKPETRKQRIEKIISELSIK